MEDTYQKATTVIFSEKLFDYSLDKQAVINTLSTVTSTLQYQCFIKKCQPKDIVTLKEDIKLTPFYYSALFAKKNPNNPNKHTIDTSYLKNQDDAVNLRPPPPPNLLPIKKPNPSSKIYLSPSSFHGAWYGGDSSVMGITLDILASPAPTITLYLYDPIRLGRAQDYKATALIVDTQ